MKTRIFIVFSILTVSMFILSCDESFLEKKPIALVNDETFYTTMESVDLATTAAYSMFSMEKIWDLSILMTLGSIASDEAEAGAGGKSDVLEYQAIDQLRHNPQTPQVFDWTWGYCFRSVNHCNVALARIPEISAETDPNYDPEIVGYRLGEIKFVRALNYFTLTQIYGGVPLVLDVLPASEYNKPRSPISDIYAAIKSDLFYAINALPVKNAWGSDDVGRATKGAAQALLAKVYLYESSYAKNYPGDERFGDMNQHWDSAAYWAEQVMTSGQYELIGINGERWDSTWRERSIGGYTWIFMAEANNSREEVFSIQARQDGLGWFNSRGTSLVRWCAPRKVNLPTSGPDGSDYGWGWWCPTPFLKSQYEPDDPRYKTTFIEEDDSLLHSTGGWVSLNFSVLESGTGVTAHQRKYECSPEEYWDVQSTWKDGPTNVKVIRYADVVLWAAEAYFEMNQPAQALTYLNMVRTRARMSSDVPGILPDLTTITHADIRHERLVELAIEGHRYWDLVRWGPAIAEQYLDHTLSDGDEIDYIVGKHEFYPIPSAEIGMNKGLEQYPGWNY